jgi:hypothetical protein
VGKRPCSITPDVREARSQLSRETGLGGVGEFGAVDRFIITTEGPNFEELDEAELPELPNQGGPIETKFGTCIVTSTESLSEQEATPARSSAGSPDRMCRAS